MPKIPTPPPGYLTTKQLEQALGHTRQDLRRARVLDLLPHYQVASNAPNLYIQAEVDLFAHWLFIRKGLIALGVFHEKEPLANPLYGIVVETHKIKCPQCGCDAVANDATADEPRVWCPVCW